MHNYNVFSIMTTESDKKDIWSLRSVGRSFVTILPECIIIKTYLRRRRDAFCPGKTNWPLGITMRAFPWAGREPPCACSMLKWAAYPSYSIVAMAWCFLDTLPMMKIWLGLRLTAVYTLISFSLPYAWWIIIPCSYIQLIIINSVSKMCRLKKYGTNWSLT